MTHESQVGDGDNVSERRRVLALRPRRLFFEDLRSHPWGDGDSDQPHPWHVLFLFSGSCLFPGRRATCAARSASIFPDVLWGGPVRVHGSFSTREQLASPTAAAGQIPNCFHLIPVGVKNVKRWLSHLWEKNFPLLLSRCLRWKSSTGNFGVWRLDSSCYISLKIIANCNSVDRL